MDDGIMEDSGEWSTSLWQSECKDCRAEQETQLRIKRRGKRVDKRNAGTKEFEYSSQWAHRKLDRGESRSDRCERHRRAHAKAIQALAVPYIDLQVIGEVPDSEQPNGPLGGLGPLPIVHRETTSQISADKFEFGMGDTEILKLLEGLTKKRIAVVVAGTGTGKSTFMPFRLMNPPSEAVLKLTDFGPIVVTEPRRAAAIGVARYVGEELCFGCNSHTCNRHVGPGFPVGYQVSGEKCWDSACDLIYATDGTVINWIRDGHLARIGTIIVDEAHERSENIDVILTQLREQIRQHEHLRLIITSATMDEAFFVSFFGQDDVFQLSVPEKKSFGYGVPLFIGTKIDETTVRNGMELHTIPDSIVFSGWASEGPIGPDGEPENLQVITRELEKLRCVSEIPVNEWAKRDRMPQAVVDQVVSIAKGTTYGDILAFLPTNSVIESVVEKIKRHLARLPFDVYPLLSKTSKKISDKALAARRPGQKRKIVVSSNLAETSLTVKGVRYVVDSGLICEEEWDPRIASKSLPTKPHSQSGLRQRWGRVGRDAPGWVFPLYTEEQFLSLPRNTPPESTRTNLEQFYMKLVAAGTDLSNAVVPGNFVPTDDALDADAHQHVGIFESERSRALNVLKMTGALDADGDLTSFGRELERYPGDGAEALALMLADQLACVHEVALALTVLGSGHLIGSKDECILRWDKEWPSAWRVRAAQCHKALATGCMDDLDVLLRLFALWQSTTPDQQSEWCRLWWINEGALKMAWDGVMTTVDSLSAAMKQEADRKIEPCLAIRARAILSHCMVSARYKRQNDSIYRAELANSPEDAILGFGRLVETPDRILAFHRFRPTSAGDDVREPYVSHVVAMLDWAEYGDEDPDLLAFELIRRIASQPHPSPEREHEIASLLAAFPVGLVVESPPVTKTTEMPKVKIVGDPLMLPDVLSSEEDKAGFDREWNPYTGQDGETPEEEVALKVQKAHGEECNDSTDNESPQKQQITDSFDSTILERVSLVENFKQNDALVEQELPIAPPDIAMRGVIIGYKFLTDSQWGLIVDTLSENQISSDPLKQPILNPGQDVNCIVVGMVHNHEDGAVQLNRTDGLGRFYLDVRQNPGLDAFDLGFLTRLKIGSVITAYAIPEGKNGISLSLLPTARKHLKQAAPVYQSFDGRQTKFYPAFIVEPPNKWGKLIAELEHADESSGMTHRFGLHQKQIEEAGVTDFGIGTKLLLALKPDRNDRLRAAYSDENLHLRVKAVRPTRPSETISIPPRLVSLFLQRKQDLQKQWDVGITIIVRDCYVQLVADDSKKVETACKAVKSLVKAPRLSAVMTNNAGGRSARDRLEARSDIYFVWVERDTRIVTVAAKTKSVAEHALRGLLKPASGVLYVPQGKNGRLIGKGGSTIKRLREMTECFADNQTGDNKWLIRGPSSSNVKQFFTLASHEVSGSYGTITESGQLNLVPDSSATDQLSQKKTSGKKLTGDKRIAKVAVAENKDNQFKHQSGIVKSLLSFIFKR